MKLTANQMKHFDEIHFDKRSTDGTLQVALQHHSNTMNNILKDEQMLWEDLIEIHNLDPTKKWTINKVDGSMVIIKSVESEVSDD